MYAFFVLIVETSTAAMSLGVMYSTNLLGCNWSGAYPNIEGRNIDSSYSSWRAERFMTMKHRSLPRKAATGCWKLIEDNDRHAKPTKRGNCNKTYLIKRMAQSWNPLPTFTVTDVLFGSSPCESIQCNIDIVRQRRDTYSDLHIVIVACGVCVLLRGGE